MKEKETEKQIEYIRFIESETGIVYLGNSKKEASEYISKNKSKLSFDSIENTWAIENGY